MPVDTFTVQSSQACPSRLLPLHLAECPLEISTILVIQGVVLLIQLMDQTQDALEIEPLVAPCHQMMRLQITKPSFRLIPCRIASDEKCSLRTHLFPRRRLELAPIDKGNEIC